MMLSLEFRELRTLIATNAENEVIVRNRLLVIISFHHHSTDGLVDPFLPLVTIPADDVSVGIAQQDCG
jgi:hypothetical protein